MRVLFLAHAHPELQAGGTEIFARDLFRELRRLGVQGLFAGAAGAHQRPPSPGTAIQVANAAPDEVLLWTAGFDPFFLSQIDLHGVSDALASVLHAASPDVIHFHHFMGLGVEAVALVRRLAPRAALVATLHDYYLLCPNDGQMVTTDGKLCTTAGLDRCRSCFPDRSTTDFKLRQLHIETALSQIDHFISPSRFLRERFVRHGWPADKITVAANGLPPVQPTPARHSLPRNRFAYFGNINRFKGVTVALEASTILSRGGVDHTLHVHGSPRYQSEETIARFSTACDAAPQARVRGAYERREFAERIAEADWVIFPSEWWENAPLVINEAFQHWRPVICSGIGGAAELVRDEVNGLHFPVGDSRALAEVMRRAIDETGLWQRLVDGIERPVSIAAAAQAHLELYRELLGHRRGKLAA